MGLHRTAEERHPLAMRYISKSERQAVIKLDALCVTLENEVLPHAEGMPKSFTKRMRSVYTNLKNGLTEYWQTLSAEDKRKISAEHRKHNLVFTSKAYNVRETEEYVDVLATLAEFAIGNTCTGCTKDGETCDLKHALALADVPYSTTEPKNCPFELEAE
jgi:hypothetical protein